MKGRIDAQPAWTLEVWKCQCSWIASFYRGGFLRFRETMICCKSSLLTLGPGFFSQGLFNILCQLLVLSPQTAHLVGMVSCVTVPSVQECYTSLHLVRNSLCLLGREVNVHLSIWDARLGHGTFLGQKYVNGSDTVVGFIHALFSAMRMACCDREYSICLWRKSKSKPLACPQLTCTMNEKYIYFGKPLRLGGCLLLHYNIVKAN